MKTVALISGGKDSCFNMMCCVAEGHDVVALANLRPEEGIDELDSYMFQSVGHTVIDLYADAMDLPLYTRVIKGHSLDTSLDYSPQDGDEVEDLYLLLQTVKSEMSIEAVSVGAIMSDYQRIRVENVCSRLGLTVLAFLWRREQSTLLKEMIDCGVHARIIKVAAMGLDPEEHLALTLEEIYPHMLKMEKEYGLNVCGEGGEYETFVLDCPLFQKRIRISQVETIIHSDDAFAVVGYINMKEFHLENKEGWDRNVPLIDRILNLPITTSKDWIQRCLDESNEPETQCLPEPEGIMVSVPKWNASDGKKPTFETDGTIFQLSGIRAHTDGDIGVKEATEKALKGLNDCLVCASLRISDIASMSLYVGDMKDFGAINSVYIQFFKVLPPVRVCVQANLPRNIALQLDCQGRVQREEGGRKCMHVQGLSHWAPANIGPYSQAIVTGDKLYMAGIVPLVPATLAVVPGGIVTQCSVALRHVISVMSAIEKECTLACSPLVMCYLTSADFIQTAQMEYKKAVETQEEGNRKRKVSTQIQYVIVPSLPKNVAVEWQVSAWPHLSDDSDITDIEFSEQHDQYRLFAKAVFCADQRELFSCHISAEVKNPEMKTPVDPSQLSTHVLQLYCRVLEKRESKEMPPLVKVFFSPMIFRYPVLDKCFSDAIVSLNHARFVSPPVLSLVPVTELETANQILAWCQ